MFLENVVGKHLGSWRDVQPSTLEPYEGGVIAYILEYIFLINYPEGLAVAEELGIQDLDILNYEPEEFEKWEADVWRPPWEVAAAARRFKAALEGGHPGALDALRNGRSAAEWKWGPKITAAVAEQFELLALVCDSMTDLGETLITFEMI
jgi:hypothetical protein